MFSRIAYLFSVLAFSVTESHAQPLADYRKQLFWRGGRGGESNSRIQHPESVRSPPESVRSAASPAHC
jgi:hypothetical protein